MYFRAESVDLAVQMLDDTDFRFGVPDPRGTMRVQPADFSYKQQSGQDQSLQDKKKNMKEKRKVIAKTQKLNKYVLIGTRGCSKTGIDTKL